MLIGIFAALLMAGCVSPSTEVPPGKEPAKPECRTVTEQVPQTKEECGELAYTEPVCGLRKLNYSITQPPRVDLCIEGPGCVGKPLGDCQACTKAMTRCIMTIKNEEEQKAGTWVVGANYSLNGAGFIKEPISSTIDPGKSFAFDFNQIYNPGSPISSAKCVLFVISDPWIEDCHEETRTKIDCRNVTTTVTVQREVCQ
jgi:hypothetical protein